MSPTIVLVHGAFAESASWDGVIDPLRSAGHPVVAAANPLRGLAADARSVSDLVGSIEGPVMLVAHSYGGAVISNVDADCGDIVGLVYVNGFAPAPGESCFALAAKFPGSTLGETTLRPVSRSDGTTDLYIVADRFRELFCADAPAPLATRLGVTQRPATQEALVEPSGARRCGRTCHPGSWSARRIASSRRRAASHGRSRGRAADAGDSRRLARVSWSRSPVPSPS